MKKILSYLLIGPSIALIFFFIVGYFSTTTWTSTTTDRTKHEFTMLVSYLHQYRKLSSKGYPTNEQGLQALLKKPTTEPLPEDWVQAVPEIPLDPWKNPYRYQMPGSKKENEPELISAGPDGIWDTEDDLSSQD